MKRKLTLCFALLLAALPITGCSSPNSSSTTSSSGSYSTTLQAEADYGYYNDYAYDDYDSYAEEAIPMDGVDNALTGGGEVAVEAISATNRKIIYTVNLNLQTMNFDQLIRDLEAMTQEQGGYVESSYVEGLEMNIEWGRRYSRYTLRIPTGSLDSFTAALEQKAHITSTEKNTEDITNQYYDVDARLTALRVQEERLLEMLEQSPDVEYLIQVEQQLSQVRYQIESLTSALRRMDSQVSYSTIHVSIYEVVSYEPVENVPVTFSQRVSRAFSNSWTSFAGFLQDLTVGIVAALPFLLLMGVIAVVVIVIVRSSAKRRQNRPAKPIAPLPPLPSYPPQAPTEKTEEDTKD